MKMQGSSFQMNITTANYLKYKHNLFSKILNVSREAKEYQKFLKFPWILFIHFSILWKAREECKKNEW